MQSAPRFRSQLMPLTYIPVGEDAEDTEFFGIKIEKTLRLSAFASSALNMRYLQWGGGV